MTLLLPLHAQKLPRVQIAIMVIAPHRWTVDSTVLHNACSRSDQVRTIDGIPAHDDIMVPSSSLNCRTLALLDHIACDNVARRA